MCPFEINNAKRGSVKDSYIALVLMAPQGPLQDLQDSTPSPEEAVVAANVTVINTDPEEKNIDERINEIINTLNSLTAELSEISRSRNNANEVTVENNHGLRRIETASAVLDRESSNNNSDRLEDSEQFTFQKHRMNGSTVRLNVGGKVFHASWHLLLQVPDSRLGRIAQCRDDSEVSAYCDSYNATKNELFFNQRYRNFIDILDFFRSGSLHISSDACPVAFVSDLNYWGLSMNHLATCCLKKFVDTKEQLDWEDQKVDEVEEPFPDGAPKVQRALWDLFEHPHTSIAARVVGILSVSCIFISTIILTLDTLPYFNEHEAQIAGEFAAFVVIEAIYMAWFTIEFLVRMVCCPSKIMFLKKSMNWIDLLAIVPYFVTVTLNSYGVTEEALAVVSAGEDAGTGDVSRTAQYFRLLKMARIVKTLRIIRIFKLARHSTGLQALGNTMKANYKELGLLFLLLGMGAIMFASLIFVFEKEDPESTFKTMFDSYWWAIITMTTVGYGDVSPITGFGKVLGCFCAIFGVLVIGLPIPIIGNSFNKFYARQKRWEKRETMSAHKKSQNLSTSHKISVDEKDILSVRGL